METLSAYLASDRRRALARGKALPDRTTGAALFADISGFTSLTERLARTLGPRRGAEELSIHLNAVYEALIEEVDRFGGNVVAFAGDAITAWFDQDDGHRATTAGSEMQRVMSRFSGILLADGERCTLSVKVGVAAGPVRRFLVGDPKLELLDVLAGGTLTEMATAGGLARPGELLVTARVAKAIEGSSGISEWRHSPQGGRYAVVSTVSERALEMREEEKFTAEESALRPYLLRPVWERLQAGQGEFLTELRPATALFLSFQGIDYDGDEGAGGRLDQLVCWVQGVVDRFGGFLLALGTGDKGSHLYCCFGAPVAHEHSLWRAISAAAELRTPPPFLKDIGSIRIGICSGTMLTGAYGSTRRRTYGVLGDAVNLAARLMEHATPGQVLVGGNLDAAALEWFTWERLTPIQLKGKTQAVPVCRLISPAEHSGTELLERQYALPMVGRRSEMDSLEAKLHLAQQGKGQVVWVTAEAGLGKSRLTADFFKLSRERGFGTYIGQCMAHGIHTPYLAWQGIWRGLLGIDAVAAGQELESKLKRRLEEIDPTVLARMPLLSPVLNVTLEDNDLTRPMEPKLRKTSLHALLMTCLRGISKRQTLVLILEDRHWMDPISQELLELVSEGIRKLRVLVLVTQRPPEPGILESQPIRGEKHFTELTLQAFTEEEIAQLVSLKLEQLFSFRGAAPAELLKKLVLRSAGNPFYVEELLNFIRDRSIDFRSPEALDKCDLPDSLQALILSRIDQLTQTEQSTLKVASVIGRLFPAGIIWGMLGKARESVVADLAHLCEVQLVCPERPEPELVYLFKHVITQEVAYESLPHGTRSRLHNQVGLCLELAHSGTLERHLDLLAFHFERSENLPKKREYLDRAGRAAQQQYANQAAVSYFERLLPLLSLREQVDILLELGRVWELTGEWKKARSAFESGLELTRELNIRQPEAQCHAALGDLFRRQGLCAEAAAPLSTSRRIFEELGDKVGLGQVLHTAGTVAAMVGDYGESKSLYEMSLKIRQELGDQSQTASLLSNLGILARYRADLLEARRLMEESLNIRRSLGDRWAVANSLNNLGVVLRELNEYGKARELLQESLVLNRQVGDPWAIANTLCSVAELGADEQDWVTAHECLRESLRMNIELGDRITVAYILECFARTAAARNQNWQAMQLSGAASSLRTELRSPLSPSETERLNNYLKPAFEALSNVERQAAFSEGSRMTFEEATSLALAGGNGAAN